MSKHPYSPLTKVALVDDHTLFREGLAKVIDEFNNYKVTIKAGNGKEFIDQLKPAHLPDIVLLDLNMPIMDGCKTAEWLITNYQSIPILILTMFDSELAISRLLSIGVKSFIKKDMHPNELKCALNAVIKKGHYHPPAISMQLGGVSYSSQLKNATKPFRLTENETTFMKWSTTDLTYREIAEKMCVSERTVENYWESLKYKLSVKNRIALAMYAVKNGVADI